mmetsp:Transcript_22162/g.39865  ORF Transcript_22162/g.39865 Transcript_22162/m.39865 type:complete len:267 (-) Transcript_22162:674-1474(-)
MASASTCAASCSALACSNLALAILAFLRAASNSCSWMLRSFLADVRCCFCFFLSIFMERRSSLSSFSSSFLWLAFSMAASRLAAAAACFSFNSFMACSNLAFPAAFLSMAADMAFPATSSDSTTLAATARVEASHRAWDAAVRKPCFIGLVVFLSCCCSSWPLFWFNSKSYSVLTGGTGGGVSVFATAGGVVATAGGVVATTAAAETPPATVASSLLAGDSLEDLTFANVALRLSFFFFSCCLSEDADLEVILLAADLATDEVSSF